MHGSGESSLEGDLSRSLNLRLSSVHGLSNPIGAPRKRSGAFERLRFTCHLLDLESTKPFPPHTAPALGTARRREEGKGQGGEKEGRDEELEEREMEMGAGLCALWNF